jgi:hypothetical protein
MSNGIRIRLRARLRIRVRLHLQLRLRLRANLLMRRYGHLNRTVAFTDSDMIFIDVHSTHPSAMDTT